VNRGGTHPGPVDPDQLFTPEEAAALLNVKPQTLAKWRMGGRGLGPHFVKVGRAIRYRRATLVSFIEGNTFTNTAEARSGLREQ